MKKVLLSGVALLATVVAASAADLPSRKGAPLAPLYVPFTWTGFYVGVQAGYQSGNETTTEFATATGVPTGFAQSFDPDGFIGGGHVGVNYQMNQFVFGIEGDFEGTDVKDGYRLANGNGTDSKIDWQASIRGRIGIAYDRLLIYATGGVAFADHKYTYFNAAFGRSEGISDTLTGYTVGGGVEYAFTNNITARAEYRYTQYDNQNYANAFAFPGFSYQQEPDYHAVRVGVSYKF